MIFISYLKNIECAYSFFLNNYVELFGCIVVLYKPAEMQLSVFEHVG